ncbi:hypothetical protein [Nocardioides humi]|uniref:DUF4064 domain-containing protein n=1 Tax=Nocardioides humi TaxID=449461 RepID=A0ABN1ZUE1_9ACTN|nr:hypothetical protein [Nocardioides humi]
MSQEQPRPGQATLAGALIVGGSVFVVLAAWQRISSLHTLEVQEELQRVLTEPMTANLGLSVDGLATAIRILCLVGAGAATASAILGIQVFKRSAGARVALTVLAPLLFVGGLATAGFLAPMVLAGIALLWLQPTRDWYAGRPWIQRYEERRAARLAALRPPGAQAPPGTPAPPAVVPPSGPAPLPPPGARGRVDRGARPPALVAACVLTWIASGLVVLALALVGTWVAQHREQVFADVVRDQPSWLDTSQVTEADVVASVYLLLGGVAAWALGAAVLAVLALVGQNWARITLAISGGCAALLALLLSLGVWPLVILVAMLAGSTWLLIRPEVARWYAGR